MENPESLWTTRSLERTLILKRCKGDIADIELLEVDTGSKCRYWYVAHICDDKVGEGRKIHEVK